MDDGRRPRLALLTLLLCSFVLVPRAGALPPPAEACKRDNPFCHTTCPTGQKLVRIPVKNCPGLRGHDAIQVRRACCMRPSGRITCREFPQCPPRSPS
jgi:hypothetical protein